MRDSEILMEMISDIKSMSVDELKEKLTNQQNGPIHKAIHCGCNLIDNIKSDYLAKKQIS